MIRKEVIGKLSFGGGCNCFDEYILITNLDDDFKELLSIKNRLKEIYCYDVRSNLNFCNRISIQRVENTYHKVICIVHHQMDN